MAMASWPRRCASTPPRGCPSTCCPPPSPCWRALPLTPNGKLDRAALPAPGHAAGPAPPPARHRPRRNPVRPVRRRARPGPRPGPTTASSTSAATPCWPPSWSPASARSSASKPKSRALFEAPTPAELAARLGAGRPGPGGAWARGRGPTGSRCRSPSSGCGSWPSWRAPARPTTSRWRVRLTGDLDTAALRAALADVIARHEVLRTIFPAVDGQPCQQILDPGAGWAGTCRWPRWPRRTWPMRSRRWRREPFDLATQIPLRARLLRVGPDEHVLVVVIHHIASDGWSTGAAGPRRLHRLHRPPPGPGTGLGAAAGAVRRLRPLAAGTAGRGRRPRQPARRAGGLLAAGPGRGTRRTHPAHRPAPPRHPQPPGAHRAAGGPGGVAPAAGWRWPARTG